LEKISAGGAGRLLNKTLSKNEREIKRIAQTGKPPVVIPVIVVAVDVHVALVIIPAIEGSHYFAKYRLFHHPLKFLNDLRIESNFVSKIH